MAPTAPFQKNLEQEKSDSADVATDSSVVEGNTKSTTRGNSQINWFFTFNNYKDEDIKLLESRLQEICVYYIFQKEIGKLNKTPHLQGCLRLKKKMRWSEFHLPKEISWSKTRKEANAASYCIKDDTSVGERYIWGEVPQKILNAMSKDKVVPKKPLKLITNLRPFQIEIEKLCLLDPEDRKINWIADINGEMGKTQFCRYMIAKYDSLCSTITSHKDVCFILATAMENGKDLNDNFTFLFNLPRDFKPKDFDYKLIESIKDGLITSAKYKSSTLLFNPPHIWVLCNFFPEMDKLTQDKWNIWKINDNFELIKHIEPNEYPFLEPKKEYNYSAPINIKPQNDASLYAKHMRQFLG